MKKFQKKYGKAANRLFIRPDKKALPAPLGIIEEEREHMPVEIATSLLLEPKARLLNTWRKACWAARQKHFVSTVEPKSFETKITERFSDATWVQLVRWTRRVEKRLRGIEYAEAKLSGMDEKTQKKRQVLMMREGLLETVLGCLVTESTNRIHTIQ